MLENLGVADSCASVATGWSGVYGNNVWQHTPLFPSWQRPISDRKRPSALPIR